jgi:hypothetical protein
LPRLGQVRQRFAVWHEKLVERFGYRIVELPLDQVPLPNLEAWIAAPNEEHVCAVRGLTPINDLTVGTIRPSALCAAYRVVPA